MRTSSCAAASALGLEPDQRAAPLHSALTEPCSEGGARGTVFSSDRETERSRSVNEMIACISDGPRRVCARAAPEMDFLT